MDFKKYVTSQKAQINKTLNENIQPLNNPSIRMCDQLQQSSHPLALHNHHQLSEEWATLNSDISEFDKNLRICCNI